MITYPHYRSWRFALLMPIAICLLFAGFCHALLTFSQIAYAQPVRVVRQHQANAKPATSVTKQSDTTAAAAVMTAYQTPRCQANMTYNVPAALPLSDTTAGLTNVVDTPAYYQIYGVTAATVAEQLTTCAPHFNGTVAGANYLAYTSYHIDWQYDTRTEADGSCSLANIKVGQHSSQTFPNWNSAADASGALNQQWANFAANLRQHEAGHLALNNQYAERLLQDLQAMQHVSCTALAANVSVVGNADLAALNAAHLQHDVSTGYGASEGAVWRVR